VVTESVSATPTNEIIRHSSRASLRKDASHLASNTQTITAKGERTLMNGFNFFDSNSIPWRKSTFAEGVHVKDLGTSDGRSMQLVRFEPGTAFPIHTHAGPEFIFLLEGEAIQEGHRLLPGWAAVARTDTIDTNYNSPSGCVFLTVYSD
jgi:ChrR Cupin-like domain